MQWLWMVIYSFVVFNKHNTARVASCWFIIYYIGVFNLGLVNKVLYAGIAQSVWRLAKGWAPGNRIPVGARFSVSVLTGPGDYPTSCTMGTGSSPKVKRPWRGFDHPPPPPPLAPRLKKSRVVPLLPLWAFVAYSSVNFIFMPFPFVPWALTMSCFFISIKFNGHLLTFKLKAPMPITKRAQRHK